MVQFTVRHLHVLSYATGFTLWHYRTNEPTEIDGPAFFDPAIDMFAAGDMITASGTNGGVVRFVLSVAPTVTLGVGG